jgi:CBS domain-containing protein
MKASDVMSRGVITATADMRLRAALRLMLNNHISGLPVLDKSGTLIGIVSEGDLLRRAELSTETQHSWLADLFLPAQTARDYVASHGRRVGDVMTRKVVTIETDTPLDTVVRLMEHHRIKRIPVVDRHRVVGIVTRADLLKALAEGLPASPMVGPTSDQDIQSQLLIELGKQSWWSKNSRVAVEDGIVFLQGVVVEEEERKAMLVAAANTAGVKAVRDEMICIKSGLH